jgi:hypothetical protein
MVSSSLMIYSKTGGIHQCERLRRRGWLVRGCVLSVKNLSSLLKESDCVGDVDGECGFIVNDLTCV